MGEPQKCFISTASFIAGMLFTMPANCIEVAEWTPGGLSYPWALALLPNGTMAVTEHRDRKVVIVDGTGDILRKMDAPPQFLNVMDIVLSPQFQTDHRILICGVVKGDPPKIGIVSMVLDQSSLSDPMTVFEGSPQTEFGACKMVFDGPALFLSSGNGGVVPVDAAQRAETTEGKIVKIDPAGRHTNWSKGHRNIEGLAISRDGDLWAHEHGPRGGDELNVIRRGSNYGWPLTSYGINYSGTEISGKCDDCIDPIYYWTPSIAPSGMAFWQDALWIGALRGRMLIRLDIKDGAVRNEQRFDMKYRIRDVRAPPKKNPAIDPLWVLTDGENGKILRVWN